MKSKYGRSRTGAFTKRRRQITVPITMRFRARPAQWTLAAGETLTYTITSGNLVAIDPWEVRDEFLSLPRDTTNLLTFLNKVGSWDLSLSFKVSDFWKWQDILRIVIEKPGKWKTAVLSLDRNKSQRLSGLPRHSLAFLQPSGEFKGITLSCPNYRVIDAIISSIRLDEAKLLKGKRTRLKIIAKTP